MCCNPGLYRRLGKEGHRSCAENIAEAVSAAGMAAGMADADAVEFVVAIVGRPEHLLREVAAMKTCCVVGRSF